MNRADQEFSNEIGFPLENVDLSNPKHFAETNLVWLIWQMTSRVSSHLTWCAAGELRLPGSAAQRQPRYVLCTGAEDPRVSRLLARSPGSCWLELTWILSVSQLPTTETLWLTRVLKGNSCYSLEVLSIMFPGFSSLESFAWSGIVPSSSSTLNMNHQLYPIISTVLKWTDCNWPGG